MSVLPLTLEGRAAEIIADDPSAATIAFRPICRPSRLRRISAIRRSLAAPTPKSRIPLWIRRIPRWKRSLDIVAAAGALLMLLPVMLVVAALVRLSSRGPVVFRQKRAGLGGKPFTIFKFRTMRAGASELTNDELRAYNEQDGPVFKMKDDPRLTPVGKFLRRTSLDELPQLWNVLRGEMSLVGPRPLEWSESMACDAWQRRRLEVTPGITCIWQVSGRSNLSFAEWVRMDLEYVRRRSLVLDLWILIRTIPAVLCRRGAI